MYHECYDPQLVIPSTFEECLTYEMQILYLKKYIDDIASGGIPEADLSEIKAQIADLESRMDTVEGEIGALDPEKVQEQLDTFSQELTAMNETLNGFRTQLTGLNETVSGHTETIATLTRTQTTQGQTITQHGEQLTSNTEAIESLETEYGTLAEKVNTQATQIQGKQDKLTFDSTPTAGSNNPVTSDGIKKAIEAGGGGGGSVILDDTVTQASQNGVKSSGIYSFVHGITNPLETTVGEHTSKIGTLTETQTTQGETITQHGEQLESNSAAIESLESEYGSLAEKVNTQGTQIQGKQDKLTFDSTPTAGSNNPVTSDGIKKAIDAGGGGGGSVILDDTVTQASQNGVKSSGIYSFVHGITNPLETTVGEHTSKIGTLTETQTTQGETITQQGEQLTTLAEKVNTQGTQIQSKQDKLTFDSTPTEGSNNPVTSDGIKKAIEAGGGGGGGGAGFSLWKFSPTTEGGAAKIQFHVNVNFLEEDSTTFTTRDGTIDFLNCTILVPVPTDASVGDLYLGTMMVGMFGSGITLPWPSDQPFVVAVRIVDLEQHIASVMIPPTGAPYREQGPVDYISVMYASATANVTFTV